jgi:CelD/BcsL family acetyltransferase involved in cellulose biosynthesis
MSATLNRIADFRVISSESGFAELREGWDDLVRAMPRPSPFLLHGWLREWLRHYGGESELAVQAAFRDGRLVGAFPLFRKYWRGLRVARFLGGAHPSLADLLLAPGEDGAVGAALLERASSEHDFAELFGLAGQSRAASIAGPAQLQLFERAVAPVLELTDDWDAIYAAKVSVGRRKDERRRRRRLEERGPVELSVASSPEAVESALADAFRLHEHRWQGRKEDTSAFVTPDGISFHRDALRALAADDVVRLFTIRLGGLAIAFELTFELSGRLYLYRTAFDPAFARYGPGLLVLLDVIAYASRERMSRVEFLGGGETYKLALADRLEPLHLGLGLAATARGRAVVTTRTGVLRLRERLKHSPTARRAWDSSRPLRARLTRAKNDLRT